MSEIKLIVTERTCASGTTLHEIAQICANHTRTSMDLFIRGYNDMHQGIPLRMLALTENYTLKLYDFDTTANTLDCHARKRKLKEMDSKKFNAWAHKVPLGIFDLETKWVIKEEPYSFNKDLEEYLEIEVGLVKPIKSSDRL